MPTLVLLMPCVKLIISIVPTSALHTEYRDGRLMFLLSILPPAFVFYFQLKYIIFHISCQYYQHPKTTLIIPKTHRLSQSRKNDGFLKFNKEKSGGGESAKLAVK